MRTNEVGQSPGKGKSRHNGPELGTGQRKQLGVGKEELHQMRLATLVYI